MVAKSVRTVTGITLCLVGIIFTIIPGSILFVLAGLFLLSYDYPLARKWLTKCQNMMASGARKLDKWLINQRLKKK